MTKFLPIASVVCALAFGSITEAAESRIIKVLPHFLDLEGRASLSPSLYERDAYQAHLRDNPSKQSALRFNVQWKTKRTHATGLKLRLELRTSATGEPGVRVFEESVTRSRWFGTWSAITIERNDFRNLGNVVAWRATLWEGERQMAELKSFLW